MARSRVIEWRDAIRDSDSLSARARLVAYTIASYMHVDGTGSHPSLETLARGCKRGKKAVLAGIAELELAGYLVVEHGGGRGCPNRYSARFPDADDECLVPAEPCRFESETVSSAPPNGVVCVPQTGSSWLREVERRNRKEVDAEVEELAGGVDSEDVDEAERIDDELAA